MEDEQGRWQRSKASKVDMSLEVLPTQSGKRCHS